MPAFNLAVHAKLQEDKIRRGILLNLLRYSPAMEWIPFENVDSLQNIAVRWTNLPDVAFRRINEGYTPSQGDYDQVTEAVYGLGGEIEFDRVFGKVKNTIVDPKVDQVKQKMKALGFQFNDYLINGDHAVDEDGFEGLKKRIDNMPARQKVNMDASTNAYDPTATTAASRRYFDKFEEAMFRANQGDVQLILANEGQVLGLGRVLRNLQAAGTFLSSEMDAFGKPVYTYRGVPIKDIGFKKDQANEIITDSEEPGDGGADATSIYFLPLNNENGVTGIQLSDPEVYDPLKGGERESKPTNLIRLDWWLGLATFGSYGPVRLHNIEKASAWT
jgi:hypothetical protein